MLIGVTASSLQGDSCSWLLRYQFHQLDKNLTSLTKLSALIVDLGTTQQGTWSHPSLTHLKPLARPHRSLAQMSFISTAAGQDA